MKLTNQLKREFGFYKFAILPIKLTSGKYVWLQNVFFAGKQHGCNNRYSVNHKRYELKYPAIKR